MGAADHTEISFTAEFNEDNNLECRFFRGCDNRHNGGVGQSFRDFVGSNEHVVENIHNNMHLVEELEIEENGFGDISAEMTVGLETE